MGSSLVLISEDSSRLHNKVSSSCTPWDFLRVPKQQHEKTNNLQNILYKKNFQQRRACDRCYLMPKTVTGLSPKRRVFSSLTLSSWCFHWPWTLSYLNIYVCMYGNQWIFAKGDASIYIYLTTIIVWTLLYLHMLKLVQCTSTCNLNFCIIPISHMV